jgi:hypothetical protein
MIDCVSNIIFPSAFRTAAIENFGGVGLSTHFLAGAAGILLGCSRCSESHRSP